MRPFSQTLSVECDSRIVDRSSDNPRPAFLLDLDQLLICAMFPQRHDVGGHVGELRIAEQKVRHLPFPRHLRQRRDLAAQRCRRDVRPVSDFPEVRCPFQKRCKRLIVGDDVTTRAGLQSQITAGLHVTAFEPRWQIGNKVKRELFHQTASAIGEKDSAGINIGAIYDFNGHNHRLLSAGRSFQNAAVTNLFSWHIACQITYSKSGLIATGV